MFPRLFYQLSTVRRSKDAQRHSLFLSLVSFFDWRAESVRSRWRKQTKRVFAQCRGPFALRRFRNVCSRDVRVFTPARRVSSSRVGNRLKTISTNILQVSRGPGITKIHCRGPASDFARPLLNSHRAPCCLGKQRQPARSRCASARVRKPQTPTRGISYFRLYRCRGRKWCGCRVEIATCLPVRHFPSCGHHRSRAGKSFIGSRRGTNGRELPSDWREQSVTLFSRVSNT